MGGCWGSFLFFYVFRASVFFWGGLFSYNNHAHPHVPAPAPAPSIRLTRSQCMCRVGQLYVIEGAEGAEDDAAQ